MAKLPEAFTILPQDVQVHQQSQSLPEPLPGNPITRAPEQMQGSRDWTEDFGHENGNYMCSCVECGNTFFGYKRRVTCKLCSTSKPVQGQQFPQFWSDELVNTSEPAQPSMHVPFTTIPWTERQHTQGAQLNAYDPANDPFPPDCGLTESQKSMLGKPSCFLHRDMLTPADVMEHVRLTHEYNAAREAKSTGTDKPVDTSKQQRAAQASEIEEARQAWKKAVEQRRQAIAQWDAHVKALHDAFTARRTGKQ